MKRTSLKNGFTLVETLVAVAILMVAIAGPLTVANQALTAALGSRNAMIATYLAQEGMESIKNIKDNNLSVSGNTWTDGWAGNITCSAPTSGGSIANSCATPSLLPLLSGSNRQQCISESDCRLYVEYANSDGSESKSYFYTNSGQNRATPFTRYYYVTPVANQNELIVTVVVQWTDGAIPNAITLQELMTNTVRN